MNNSPRSKTKGSTLKPQRTNCCSLSGRRKVPNADALFDVDAIGKQRAQSTPRSRAASRVRFADPDTGRVHEGGPPSRRSSIDDTSAEVFLTNLKSHPKFNPNPNWIGFPVQAAYASKQARTGGLERLVAGGRERRGRDGDSL